MEGDTEAGWRKGQEAVRKGCGGICCGGGNGTKNIGCYTSFSSVRGRGQRIAKGNGSRGRSGASGHGQCCVWSARAAYGR